MPFADDFASGLLDQVAGRTFSMADLTVAAEASATFILALGTPLGLDLLPVQQPLMELALRILGMAASGRRKAGDSESGSPPTLPLVVIRSTVVPGTTDGVIRAAGARLGLVLGQDYLLAVCPERTLEGHSEELLELPQIIGARDDRSAEAAAAVFGRLGIDLVVTGTVEAELAKLYANAYRYVGFALSNEFMMIARAHGARPHEALRAANLGYRRGGIPAPGYASGPCLFKDGFLLGGRMPAVGLLLAGWRVNEGLPEYFIEQVEAIRPLGKAAVLGLGFKADSDDPRNSLGPKLVELLRTRGVETAAHDPVVTGEGVTSDLTEALGGADEVFVMVPHHQYRELAWAELGRLVAPGCVVADPWLVWGQTDVVVRLGQAI